MHQPTRSELSGRGTHNSALTGGVLLLSYRVCIDLSMHLSVAGEFPSLDLGLT